MNCNIRSAVLGALLAVGSIGATQASTISATFTGTFGAGSTDLYGWVSGTSGTNLSGQSFTGTVSYLSGFSESVINSGYSCCGGGSALDIKINVGGYILDIDNLVQMSEQAISGGAGLEFRGYRNGVAQGGLFLRTTTAYTALQLQTQQGLDTYMAGLTSWTGTGSNRSAINLADWWGHSEALYFSVDQVTANTPEPASLALLGLGIAGLMARRRKAA